jgi:hypothetical protein
LLDLVREEKDFWKGSAFVISLFISVESIVPLVLSIHGLLQFVPQKKIRCDSAVEIVNLELEWVLLMD